MNTEAIDKHKYGIFTNHMIRRIPGNSERRLKLRNTNKVPVENIHSVKIQQMCLKTS